MTSIIKVDTIQTKAGAAPTTTDLGLNVAGQVVDYQRRNFVVNNIGSTTSGSMVNVTGVYVDITPKSSTNLLVFKTDIMTRVGTTGNYCRFDIYDTNASARWNTGTYVQSSNYYAGTSEFESLHIAHANTAGTTSAMRLQLRSLVTSGATLFLDWSSVDQRTVEVWEIAQ